MEEKNIKLFDSHCHPQFPQYDEDRDKMMKRTLNEGVFMICVGTDLETSKQAIKLAEKYEGIWATAGLHPTDMNQEFRIKDYEELLKNERVVAIGEVGLDYYRIKNQESQVRQKEIFMKFLELAIKYNKPLILHCREAYDDMIQILSSNLRGVIHSFTSDWQTAQKFIDSGFYIGLNGIITFTEQYNETVINASLDNILLETDAPFLTPLPFRGKRNEPIYVKYVAEKIAELKSLSYSQVAEKTFENTKKLFVIK